MATVWLSSAGAISSSARNHLHPPPPSSARNHLHPPPPSLLLLPRSRRTFSLHSSSSSLFGFTTKLARPAKISPFSATISMSMEAGVGVMGTKLGMMTYFETDGTVVPVTVVGFKEGNIVTQVKTEATDGYNSVQVGYRRVRDRKLTKPEMGHLQKSGIIPLRHLQEFRLTAVDGFEPNQRLVFEELFKEGDLVDVSGTTIGKGFQGGIKRHNFKRGLMTHGSKSHRALGSIGAGTTPGRVYKGKKMPGRMGGTKRKIRKLKIVKIDNDLRVVMIKGAVPGKPGNLLRIAPAKIVGKNIPKS
ncbi:50S ribosomal protein L3, chloroplastic isoform X1 [Diospyros lotus]|uniref:50S ribosomal protein L3, chloroplastic isoform X1 n=1 Tax=Diospyros lotus TaxID=55363 RepID=UPI00225433AB|nr:50S ribosomal protein L3, chloroplastic isoform X1 [Diospyros lotus]